jgi:hypothetical protein
MISALVMVALALGVTAGNLLDRIVLSSAAVLAQVSPDAASDFGLMSEAWNVIHRVYVDREAFQPITLTYRTLSEMVDALGDTGHSRLLTPLAVQQGDHSGPCECDGADAAVGGHPRPTRQSRRAPG